MIASLLALGFVPGLVAAGCWLLQRHCPANAERSGAGERLAVAVAIGMVLSLPILVGSAMLGWFSPTAIGTLGWLLAIWRWSSVRTVFRLRSRLDLPLLVAGLLLTAWHITYHTESILAGRDQGVYSNHAVHLATTGDLRVKGLFSELYVEPNRALASALQAGGYFFDFENKHVTLQFAPTFALYLAQGYGIAGFGGLFALNPLLAGINAGLFFGLARRFVSTGWAAAATALFSLNLAQVWIARITLSEMLTQTWLLAGLVLMRIALEQRKRAVWLIGSLLIASCTFIRVDAFLLVIALTAAGFYLALQPDDQVPDATWRRLGAWSALSVTALAALALAYGFATSPGYYADFAGRIALMLAIAAILAGAAWIPWPMSLRTGLFQLISDPRITRGLIVVLVLLALYAYFWRPFHEPFANFAASIGWEGRDYRENSLRDLGAYVSPVGLAFALGGVGVLLHRVLVRRSIGPLPLLGVWFAVSLLYLYNPYISTDHIWKIRRFVPVVIPGVILFAMIGLAAGTGRIKSTGLRLAAVTVALGLIFGYVGWTVRPLAFTQLNAGAVDLVKRIGERIPEDALVVTDVNRPLLGPLQLCLGLDVVRSLPGMLQQEHLVQAAVTRAVSAQRPVVLLSKAPMVNSLADNADEISLTHPTLVKTISPPPREVAPRTRTAYVSVLDPSGLGFRSTAAYVRLGANRIFGVTETGFKQQEFGGRVPFRWTEARATLSTPWIFERPPLTVSLHILSAAPGGSQTRVTLNDHMVLNTQVPDTGGTYTLPVDQVDWSQPNLTVVIETSTFIPSQTRPGSTDDRELGLQLGGLTFELSPPWENDLWEFGLGQHAREAASGLYPPEPFRGGSARWTDGNTKFTLQLSAEHPPKRLTIPVESAANPGVEMEVRWNGERLTESAIPRFPHQLVLDLADLPASNTIELEILSDTFVPADRDPTSTDSRKLGVMLGPMTLTW